MEFMKHAEQHRATAKRYREAAEELRYAATFLKDGKSPEAFAFLVENATRYAGVAERWEAYAREVEKL